MALSSLRGHGTQDLDVRESLPVLKADEYRRHSQDCRDLATKMKAGEQRDALLRMAQTWDALAQQRERSPRVQREGEAGETEKVASKPEPPPSR
jgi:hypothetical protein